ncbi:MAG: hypothetical protein D6713_07130, partial [Deltaproteobacteria bacterium]
MGENLLGEFLRYLRDVRRVSESTLRGYESDLRQFFEYVKDFDTQAGPEEALEREDAVRSFVSSLYGKLKEASIARKLSSLRTFYRFLLKRGRISRNPLSTIRGPRTGRKVPGFLTLDEMDALLKSASGQDFLSLRDRAIIELLYSSGLRVGELVSLRVGDLRADRGIIRV